MTRCTLGLILLLSGFLHFWGLTSDDLVNPYYAAGVKSMLLNWRNFFFVAFDPAGFITIDKPPLGFWLQSLSASLFGFHGWSLILPQAAAGVLSVFILFIIVKRVHGEQAGLLAALLLAITPIVVAASRNNTIDVLLLAVSLGAALVFFPTDNPPNGRRLLFAFFLIGIGFNIKSLEAFLILPAFYITYCFTPISLKSKITHLLTATLVLLAVSLPWFIAVDSISPENRPYVGSSESNSELELATGYNGLGHFLGFGVQTPGRQSQPPQNTPPPSNSTAANAIDAARQPGGESGFPGPFRFFNRQLGGQVSWLLPLALGGMAAALYAFRQNELPERKKTSLLFWSCWLIPQLTFFSVAHGAHRYYLVMLAPAIAALAGIGYTAMVKQSVRSGLGRYVPVVAMLATSGVQIWLVAGYQEWRDWMLPVAITAGGGAVVSSIYLWKKAVIPDQYRRYAAAAGILCLCIAPFAWSLTPLLYGTANPILPYAGPDLAAKPEQQNPAVSLRRDRSKLEDFLLSHQQEETYLLAVPAASLAAPFILDTGEPVMAYGGFLGSEKIVNAAKLEQLVRSHQVRYFLLGGTAGQQPELDNWIKAHGKLVPETEWRTLPEQPVTTNPPAGLSNGRRRAPLELYECTL